MSDVGYKLVDLFDKRLVLDGETGEAGEAVAKSKISRNGLLLQLPG